MAPVQNTFSIIPDAPAALGGAGNPDVSASRHIKPPMTTKQAQKLHRKTGKGPRLSKAEQRRQDLMEQDRIRKEFEREKNQARARASRDKKKEKEDKERAERKRKGLPLVDVHPSQDTLVRFMRPSVETHVAVRPAPSPPAQDDGGIGLTIEAPPPSTQLCLLGNLDELLPTSSQELRELFEDSSAAAATNPPKPSQKRPSRPLEQDLPVRNDLDVPFFSTQDLLLSSQDLHELQDPSGLPPESESPAGGAGDDVARPPPSDVCKQAPVAARGRCRPTHEAHEKASGRGHRSDPRPGENPRRGPPRSSYDKMLDLLQSREARGPPASPETDYDGDGWETDDFREIL